MFMFLTDNENWCFEYIGSYTLIGSYSSAVMYVPVHHCPNISKTQPLDLDHGLSEGSDGVFRKDYWNRNRKQNVPVVVYFAK